MEMVLQIVFILLMIHIARLTWKVIRKKGVTQLEITIGKIGVVSLVVISIIFYLLK